MKHGRSHDTNVTPEPGRRRSAARASRPAARRSAPRPRPPGTRCSTSPRRTSASPKASLTVTNGVVSGGGRPSPTARCSATSCSTSACAARAEPRRPARPGTKPIASTSSSARARHPARRHPGQGERQVHLRPQHPGAGHAARPRRPPARPGRATATAPRRRSSRSTRARSSTSPGAKVVRFKDFVGVVAPTEYAAIQAAAQLKVKWAEHAGAAGRREPVQADARPRRGRQDAGPHRVARPATSTAAFASAPIKLSADATSSTTTGSMPIGPECCVADVTPQRRADLLEHAGRLRDPRRSCQTCSTR